MVNGVIAPFNIKQLEAEVEHLFSNSIDMSDYDKRRAQDRKDAFNSRALAAYSLYTLADISSEEAAQSIVDGFEDNGIDAVFFQRKQNILWLVQAKWRKDGKKSPEAKELRSFKDGVFDLLDYGSPKIQDRFNYKFEYKEEEIKEALNSPGLRIKIVIAYTASKLTKNGRGVLDDLVEALNDGQEIASIEDFNLDNAFNAVFERHNREHIDVQFELSNWGRVDEPYQAFYGQVDATTIGKWWIQHKNRLFSKNIREFIGSSSVNEDISRTLRSEPEVFWYLNNGITVLCDQIHKVGAKKDRKRSGFVANNISIVNGAQTIGCIGELYQDSIPEDREELENAEVYIRFISLSSCEDDFDLRVTRATNTQNSVESRDFVALDSQQERLGREFRTCGKRYFYKRTAEAIIKDDKNYELEEATVALACAQKNLDLVIAAKQDLSRLWSEPSKPPYTKLFNSRVNAVLLSRQIETKRKVEELVREQQANENKRIREAFLKHGNLFILHAIFQKTPPTLFSPDKGELEFINFKNIDVPKYVSQIVDAAEIHLEKNHEPGKLWSLFRSAKRCRELREHLLNIISSK